MFWAVLLVGYAALAVVGLRWSAAAYRWTWRERSLEARLRDERTRREVFERALARLRRDYDAGALELNESYRSLFERLTAEARAGD